MRLRVRVPPPGRSTADAGREREPDRVAGSSPLDAALETVLGAVLEDRGRELDPAVRAGLEGRFRRDLGHLRVHAGPRADAAARALDARALAVGPHLVFAAGEYRPATLDGRRLLAHEVAHAIQGSNALDPVADEPRLAAADAATDAAAERAAREAASRPDVVPLAVAPAGSPRIHRFPASVPVREAAAPLADPVVELIAIDIARALEQDPSDASARIRRRLSRMAEGMRAAVVTRVGELLTPAQREQAAATLTGAALGEERPEPAVAPEPPAPGVPAPEMRAAAPPPAPEEPVEEAVEGAEAGGAAPGPETRVAARPEPDAAVATPEPGPSVAGAEVEVAAPEGPVSPGAGPAPAPASVGRPTSGASGTAPASLFPPGAGAETAEPDLGPIDALEARIVEQQRAEEPSASAPPEAGPAPIEPESAEPESAEPESAEPTGPLDVATAPGEEVEAAPPLAPQELAVATGPEPPVTPELEAAVAEAAGGTPTATPPGGAESVAGDSGGGGGAAPATLAGSGAPGPELAEGVGASGDCGPDPAGGGVAAPAIAETPEAPVPDLSGASPAEAMGAVVQLPPGDVASALGGVGAAAAGSVAAERRELATRPPSLERPTGSPEPRPVGAASAAAARSASTPAMPATGATSARTATAGAVTAARLPIPPLPPVGAPPTQGVPAPAVAGGEHREVTAADAQALRASIDDLPVSDPALAVDAGPAPVVALEGEADPQQARDRRAQLEDRTRTAESEGRVDASRPLGEDDIYPDVPAETLTAEIEPAQPANPPAAIERPDEATAIVAREEHAAEVRSAATEAQGRMSADRAAHETQVAEGRAAAQREMDDAVRTSAEEQAGHRREARRDVAQERDRWTAEQRTAVGDGRSEADVEQASTATAVDTQRRQADREAAGEIDRGNANAAAERRDAERKARAKRDEGRRESSGVFGWLADRARGFFDALKRGLTVIFNAARELVRRAIRAAQELANAVIDRARRAIIGLIRAVADRLVAIADRVLAAFPALRDRFRAAIRRVVDAAVAAVNRLADALKEGIRRALTALGSLIEGALGLLERAYIAAIDAVAGAVQGAIRAAQAVVQLIGTFAALIRDVAADPMGWLRNLGAAVVDGLRNHVWRILKCHVKAWFNSKVEEVLGLGRMIFDLLRSGGVRIAEIGRMVWDALKAALPTIAIQLAIEKLVSLLVPAASAVMLIIDGLRAAWGAMSRIVAAFEAFFLFLRAVRGGNAGRSFAEALAAGAVALIDFLSNFLVVRLRRPAGGVAGRLGAIAQRLRQTVGRVGGAVARGARRVGAVVGQGARRAVAAARAVGRDVGRAVTGAVRRGVGAAGAAGRRAVAALARSFPRVGAAVRSARATWQRARTRFRQWRERRRQRRRETPAQRQARARAATVRALEQARNRRLRSSLLRALLLYLRARWRWRTLALRRAGADRLAVVGGFSPTNVLLEVGEQWEIWQVAFRVHRTPSTGEEYEQGVMPYIQGQLAPEIAGPRPYEFGLPGSRTLEIAPTPSHALRSRLDRIRFRIQRGIRVGQLLRRPEAYTEIYGQDPTTRRRRRVLQEVHVIEATLVTDFRSTRPEVVHKRVQIPATLTNIRQRYGADARVTYHIISPRRPSPGMIAEIERQLRQLAMPNLRIVWRITR